MPDKYRPIIIVSLAAELVDTWLPKSYAIINNIHYFCFSEDVDLQPEVGARVESSGSSGVYHVRRQSVQGI